MSYVPAPSPSLSTSMNIMSPIAPSSRSSLSALSPPAVGCLYGSSHQTYMLRQLLPTDMMTRLVDTGPLDRTAGTFGRRATAGTRSRRTTGNAGTAVVATAASSVNAMGAIGAQIIVKQGVSKCKECNIVFCKYENYLAHKKHYCSARHQQPAAAALPQLQADAEPSHSQPGDSERDRSPTFPAIAASLQHAPTTYQQVICAACGIKFTSLDNLSAHQMYYCPKRHEIQMHAAAAAAVAAKPSPATAAAEPPAASKRPAQQQQQHPYGPNIQQHQNNNNNHHHHQYRCPLCDVVSSNAGEAKRHLDTHAGVKAFRCSICRYRGNTMRGMRTHIRMHFDRKTASSEFNEEDYITCVLEENGVEVVHASHHRQRLAEVGKSNATAATAETTTTMVHSCDACSYSSTFKGNVVSIGVCD